MSAVGSKADIMATLLDFLLLWMCFHSAKSEAPECAFPQEYRGSWYQSAVGDVRIAETEMDKKGTCIERTGDFYLLENKDIGCFVCLLFHKKHENILQYQESMYWTHKKLWQIFMIFNFPCFVVGFCGGMETLYNTCNQIQPATLMRTLIREPIVPSPCPFQDAFHFTYNNNTGGFCRDPLSYAKACASDSKYRLHFKHCQNAAYTYHRDVDLQCLGTWQDDGQQYMIGRLAGPGLNDKENMYRCFIYQMLGTLMYMAMSADSSCRGLMSSRNGPVVMEMTKDVYGWPEPKCNYPAWVTKTTWRDLSGHHIYQSNSVGNIIHFAHRHKVTDDPEVHKAFRCVKVIARNTTKDEFVIMSFTSHGCTSKYQCLRLVKRKRGVIEIHEGKYSMYETETCTGYHLDNSSKSLLIPEAIHPKPCPHLGRYEIHTGSSVCNSFFRSGCNGSSIIDIVSSCSSKPGLQLECLKTWKEGKTAFVVARRPDKHDGMTNCFSFRSKGQNLHFSADKLCNIGTPYIMRDAVTYVLNAEALECEIQSNANKQLAGDEAVDSSEEPVDDDPDQQDAPVLEGSYKYVNDERHGRDHRTSRFSHATSLHYSLTLTLTWSIGLGCHLYLNLCFLR